MLTLASKRRSAGVIVLVGDFTLEHLIDCGLLPHMLISTARGRKPSDTAHTRNTKRIMLIDCVRRGVRSSGAQIAWHLETHQGVPREQDGDDAVARRLQCPPSAASCRLAQFIYCSLTKTSGHENSVRSTRARCGAALAREVRATQRNEALLPSPAKLCEAMVSPLRRGWATEAAASPGARQRPRNGGSCT